MLCMTHTPYYWWQAVKPGDTIDSIDSIAGRVTFLTPSTVITVNLFTDEVVPTEGVTRCDCGSKYWDENVCHSCGEKYRPDVAAV